MVPAPEAGRDPAASSLRTRLLVPREIGPFRILRQIGEGGMGIVFLAQQERPSRTVALKVIHASLLSPRTLRRFEQEAEVLARLQHPGIAQIYQVGTYATEQGVLPYIAMEYVEGERLDHYAAKNALGLRARLELAALLADAVEHAHQKGVIHRDLKPGNVLVTSEGQPKILDFGVARLNDDDDSRTTTLRTDVGALMGTLTYMSPEQASGDPKAIDHRSDVYSLGVVLYELLSGKLPYYLERSALPEAVRVIQNEEPSRLSTHDRSLRGDIETIVQKALEKDKQRRYPSAEAMADDIRRYLADEPILARAPSTWYQLSKFARRNRVLVAGIGAVGLALLAGAAVATHLYLREREASAREREARLEAESQQKSAETAADFLVSLFAGIDPAVARGADTTLLTRILGDARSRMADKLAGQPTVEARIRDTLGNAYIVLGSFDDAEAELERAHEIYMGLYGADDRRTVDVGRSLTHLLERRGDLRAAEEQQRATLARQESVLGSNDLDALVTRRFLGDNLMRQGRNHEAEVSLRETLARQIELGAGEAELEDTRVVLAQALERQGKEAEARALFEQIFLARSTRLGDDHPETIVALASLGSALTGVDEYAEAEAVQRDALERAERVFGADNPQTLAILNNLAACLTEAGKTVEAEPLLRDCLARRRRALGEQHPETLGTLNHLIRFLWDRGRVDEVTALLFDALEEERRVLGEDHAETLRLRNIAAFVLSRQNRFAEAAEHLEAVAVHGRKVLAEDDPQRAQDLYNWAATLQNGGDDEAAEPILREVLALVEEHGLESEAFVPSARSTLAKALARRGEFAEADPLFRSALEARRKRHGSVHAETAYSLGDYGESLLDRGDLEAAEPLLVELVRVREQLPRDDWRLASAQMFYGRCLHGQKRYAEAEAQLVAACEIMERHPEALPSAARGTRKAILALYADWDAAEPGQGIAARAERWQTPFPAEQ